MIDGAFGERETSRLSQPAGSAAECGRPLAIDAIVILPDQPHAIWTLPFGDHDFPGRWRKIKSHCMCAVVRAGVRLERNARGEYDLWQRRIWEHTVRDDRDFARCVDDIHFNPVKRGIVTRPVDWPYSSLHRYVREGVLPMDWGGGDAIDGAFGEREGM